MAIFKKRMQEDMEQDDAGQRKEWGCYEVAVQAQDDRGGAVVQGSLGDDVPAAKRQSSERHCGVAKKDVPGGKLASWLSRGDARLV